MTHTSGAPPHATRQSFVLPRLCSSVASAIPVSKSIPLSPQPTTCRVTKQRPPHAAARWAYPHVTPNASAHLYRASPALDLERRGDFFFDHTTNRELPSGSVLLHPDCQISVYSFSCTQ
eukprot:scaffold272_cov112-Isochrysis_galbana.AAC.1